MAQAPCQPGRYCTEGVAAPCPAGLYGEVPELASRACSGPCSAGYYCPAGSVTATQVPCGGPGVYCRAGSGEPTVAAPGEFTVGPTDVTRNASLPCPSGSYCVAGGLEPCVAGSYGCADRLSAPSCNGPCTEGFFCPAGSRSSQAQPCGGSATAPDAASKYCPRGSAAALRVGTGNFSTGSSDGEPHRRSGQAVCPPGHFCVGGVKVCDVPPPLPHPHAHTHHTRANTRTRSDTRAHQPPCSLCSRAAGAVRRDTCAMPTRGTSPAARGGGCAATVRLTLAVRTPPFPVQAPCPSGRFGSASAETSPGCSGTCWPGFECPAGSTAATAGVCPAGFYCQGGPRQPCPAGRYSNRTGTESAAACVACPAGTFSAASAADSESTCAPCAPSDGSDEGSVACWPGVVSAVAFNPPPLYPGFSAGDVVVLSFSSPTNTTAVVVFSPPIGVTSRSWRAGGRELWVTVVDAAGVNASAVDVATGSLFVSVRGVHSADGVSPASLVDTRVVGGTWGVPTPPAIVDAAAADGGQNVGLGTGDTLTLTFDQAVRQVAGLQVPDALTALLSFQPPLPSSVVVTGAWGSPTSLVLSLAVAGGPPPNWTRWNVGALTVAVLPSANLTSANGESGASVSTALVRGGSWGDAPGVAVFPKNSTTAVVALSLPPSMVGYAVGTFVVQWASGDPVPAAPPLPATTVDVLAWALTGVPSAPAVDGSGRAVATVRLVSSGGAGHASDAAVVTLAAPVTSLPSPLQFDIPHLTTSVAYAFRGACSGPAGVMGPWAPSDPPSITPAPPRIVSVAAPSSGLPTPGGVVLEVTGDQLGAVGSTVYLLLSSAAFGTFRTTDCTVAAPGSRVRCVSPAGVGTGLTVTVSVDGVESRPYANGTLSYSLPAITSLRVLASSDGRDVAGVPTAGGLRVLVKGVNFGPASLGAASLGAVSYSPVALSVALGSTVTFPAVDCSITRDHTEVVCGMGPGVGAGLQWSITVAGQTASTPTTGYRAPVVRGIGVTTASGAVSSSPGDLATLATEGGQQLVGGGHPLPTPLRVRLLGSGACARTLGSFALALMRLRARTTHPPPCLPAGVHGRLLRARRRAAAPHRHRCAVERRRRRGPAHRCVRSCRRWAHGCGLHRPSWRGHGVCVVLIRCRPALGALGAVHLLQSAGSECGDGDRPRRRERR